MLINTRTIYTSPLGGPGYLAGEPPADPMDPDSPDGRTRVLGALARVKVLVLEGVTRRAIASTVSAEDGTWRIDGLVPGVRFLVLFINDGVYEVEIGDEVHKVNSFAQDWIYSEPYGP